MADEFIEESKHDSMDDFVIPKKDGTRLEVRHARVLDSFENPSTPKNNYRPKPSQKKACKKALAARYKPVVEVVQSRPWRSNPFGAIPFAQHPAANDPGRARPIPQSIFKSKSKKVLITVNSSSSIS